MRNNILVEVYDLMISVRKDFFVWIGTEKEELNGTYFPKSVFLKIPVLEDGLQHCTDLLIEIVSSMVFAFKLTDKQ